MPPGCPLEPPPEVGIPRGKPRPDSNLVGHVNVLASMQRAFCFVVWTQEKRSGARAFRAESHVIRCPGNEFEFPHPLPLSPLSNALLAKSKKQVGWVIVKTVFLGICIVTFRSGCVAQHFKCKPSALTPSRRFVLSHDPGCQRSDRKAQFPPPYRAFLSLLFSLPVFALCTSSSFCSFFPTLLFPLYSSFFFFCFFP